MNTTKELNNINQLDDFSKAEIFDKYQEVRFERDKAILHMEEALATVEQLKALMRISQKSQYGASTEKRSTEDEVQLSLLDDGNLGVFNEAEEIVEDEKKVPHVRRKKGEVGPNKPCFDHLPVQEVIYELAEEDQDCSKCGSPLKFLRQEERIELEIIPVQIIKKKYISQIFSCPPCEEEGKNPIVNTSQRLPVFSGSYVSPSLLAYIMAKKYWEKVPIYRLEKILYNTGIKINRALLSKWIIDGAHLYIKGLYNLMHEELLKNSIIHADETSLQVLREPGRKAETTSYMWHYVSGHLEPKQVALYEYKPGRSGEYAANFLKGYKEYLQTDGYSGYRKVVGVKKMGCLAHARRKYIDAMVSFGKNPQLMRGTLTQDGLSYFDKLFKLEDKFKELTPEERYEKRLEHSKPLLEEYKRWLYTSRKLVPEKSKLGEAIRYSLNQWDELVMFLADGRLELTNNRAERGMKEFVIGRKNFLFSTSVQGAETSAILYSIVETAKANKLHPYEYLKYILEELSQNKQTDEKLKELLPWSDKLPDHLKVVYEQS